METDLDATNSFCVGAVARYQPETIPVNFVNRQPVSYTPTPLISVEHTEGPQGPQIIQRHDPVLREPHRAAIYPGIYPSCHPHPRDIRS
jgi:hypothetical protein